MEDYPCIVLACITNCSSGNGRRRPNETISPGRPSTATPATPTPTCPRDTNQAPAQLNLTEDQINFLYEVCSWIFQTRLIFSRYSIAEFFNALVDANPIFSREKFTQDYENCLCSQELVSIITAITAKLIGSTLPVDHESPFDIPTLDSHIDQLLSSSMLELDLVGDAPSLDHFRKSCILAFYEFHQFPGNQSWMRIARLTRMAHRIGLDRLEHLRTHYPEWRSLTEEDFREWRSIWWFIYRLDSYSNISSGTPFLIDDRFINTSLVLDPQSTGTELTHQELFLPPDASSLWEVIPTITSNPQTCLRNMHIVAIAATRQAGSALRLGSFRLQDEALQRLFSLERQLPALFLALPSGWTNPRRNALLNESRTNHHLRLNTVLVLLMSKLLLSIVTFSRGQESDWLSNWQKVIEICQDIASTAAEWDSSFSLMVDPAVCFIIFAALVFLDIHKKSERSPVSDVQFIESHQTILRLHLDQFARVWTMPKLLSRMYPMKNKLCAG